MEKYDFNIYLAIGLTFAVILRNDHKLPFIETEWFQSYWPVSVPLALLYIGLVAIGQRTRASKDPSTSGHRRVLQFWNFSLTVFSVLGAYRVGGEFVATLGELGFEATFCDNRYFHTRSVYFWYSLFVLSKLFEMGDTFFLVAANKPVRFIHWFHHATTMVYSFYIAAYLPAIGRWMSTMNFLVHSIMYFYYFLASYRVRLSRKFALVVTTMQTAQMFVGLAINLLALQSKWLGHQCSNGGFTVESGVIMYISYVFLFAKLFYNAYVQ